MSMPARSVIGQHSHCLPRPRAVQICLLLKCSGVSSKTDNLFRSIVHAWDGLPQDVADNLCGGFRSRCEVCAELGGGSLNGRWAMVHLRHPGMERKNVLGAPAVVDDDSAPSYPARLPLVGGSQNDIRASGGVVRHTRGRTEWAYLTKTAISSSLSIARARSESETT